MVQFGYATTRTIPAIHDGCWCYSRWTHRPMERLTIVSTAVGPLHYSDPRAVQVREPEDLSTAHAAVHGEVAIYVDTRNQTHAVIDRWAEIMEAASAKAVEILASVENGNGEETQV
jgi:hypothetical protein